MTDTKPKRQRRTERERTEIRLAAAEKRLEAAQKALDAAQAKVKAEVDHVILVERDVKALEAALRAYDAPTENRP